MSRKKLMLKPMDEQVVKRFANILGNCSASAQALERAEEYRRAGKQPLFFHAYYGRSSAIVVYAEDPTTPLSSPHNS